MVGGEIGKGWDGLRPGEVAVANQEAADDVDVWMNERRETVEGVWGFKLIAIAGTGGGEQGVALLGLDGNWLGEGNVAEGAVELGLGSLGHDDAGNLSGRRGVHRHEANGVGGFEAYFL